MKYSACFVICPLPKESPTSDGVPETVSVVARLKASPTNRILVQNRPETRTKDKELLAVCVKPLHYDYNRVSFTLLGEVEIFDVTRTSDDTSSENCTLIT